jgi:methylmalonyl-CoA/ethylmalonyl-CoA epimerase
MTLHHIGIAVRQIPEAVVEYVTRFGYQVAREMTHDPTQTAYIQLLQLAGSPVYLELVAPDGPQSMLTNAVKRGGGLHHLCYCTEDLEGSCRRLRSAGMYILHHPVKAVAFQGRRIAWLMGQDGIPIELLEI